MIKQKIKMLEPTEELVYGGDDAGLGAGLYSRQDDGTFIVPREYALQLLAEGTAKAVGGPIDDEQ